LMRIGRKRQPRLSLPSGIRNPYLLGHCYELG
jgi:hypothetical protein